MKIERTAVSGFPNAIYGMRAPMNSWSLSDSSPNPNFLYQHNFIVGEADNTLAKKLIKAGSDHRKFLRLIHVSCFITIPRYIWTELDTYKVATVRLSCSTMHKLGSRDLDKTDFEKELVLDSTLNALNDLGREYRKSKDVEILRKMKRILPEGFLQGAVFDASYETLTNMYHARKNHRMPEWSSKGGICEWIESLPMMSEWLNCSS